LPFSLCSRLNAAFISFSASIVSFSKPVSILPEKNPSSAFLAMPLIFIAIADKSKPMGGY
jgi:hypothetical protein